MNNFYTLQKLIKEIDQTLQKLRFDTAVSFRKHRLELYFNQPDFHDRKQITFSSHPKRISFFESKYFPPKKRDIITFFHSLNGQQVKKVEMAGQDRVVDILFEGDQHLRFQLFGHGANCYLYDNQKIIRESFRGEKKLKNSAVPEPSKPAIREAGELSGKTDRMMLQRDPRLPRQWLPDLIKHHELTSKSAEGIASFTDKLRSVLSDRPVPEHASGAQLCIIPDDWLPLERTRFESFNEAVRVAFSLQTQSENLQSGKKRLLSLLEGEKKRLKSRIKEADNAIKALDRAEKYENYANLLMAHPDPSVPVEGETLETADFYGEGDHVKIPVKSGLTPIENANRYYKKTQDARKSAEMTQGMGDKARSDLQTVEEMLKRLESISTLDELRSFEETNQKFLKDISRRSASGEQSRPFKVINVDGYEVWIGKNAKSNDAILRSSHKEDLWFHSRDGAGSHVLIRLEGNKELPGQALIEKIASVAAFHSKASGSSIVPVRYAKRKHLRKPKGAAPGLVKVDKEEVILAEPKPADEVTA